MLLQLKISREEDGPSAYSPVHYLTSLTVEGFVCCHADFSPVCVEVFPLALTPEEIDLKFPFLETEIALRLLCAL